MLSNKFFLYYILTKAVSQVPIQTILREKPLRNGNYLITWIELLYVYIYIFIYSYSPSTYLPLLFESSSRKSEECGRCSVALSVFPFCSEWRSSLCIHYSRTRFFVTSSMISRRSKISVWFKFSFANFQWFYIFIHSCHVSIP